MHKHIISPSSKENQSKTKNKILNIKLISLINLKYNENSLNFFSKHYEQCGEHVSRQKQVLKICIDMCCLR